MLAVIADVQQPKLYPIVQNQYKSVSFAEKLCFINFPTCIFLARRVSDDAFEVQVLFSLVRRVSDDASRFKFCSPSDSQEPRTTIRYNMH